MEIASIFGSRLESLFDLDTVRSSEKCVWAFKMSRPMRYTHFNETSGEENRCSLLVTDNMRFSK